MNNLNKNWYLIGIFSFVCMLTLQGCGGSDEEEKISVYAGYSRNSDDERTPNSPQAALNKLLFVAGVNSSNLRCTDLSPDNSSPNVVVPQIQASIIIVDINVSDLDKAKTVGYGLTSDIQTRLRSFIFGNCADFVSFSL